MMKISLNKKYIAAIIAAIIIVACALPLRQFLGKPSVKFLLHMSELTPPKNYTTEEQFFNTSPAKSMGVMIYRHKNIKSNKYYLIVHGLTPQDYNHPAMHLLASSICDATGMNVIKPYIKSQTKDEHNLVAALVENIAFAYKTLNEKIPGDYRAMGGCIGATSMLIAFERVPRIIYPKKVLLFGPVFNGKAMLDFYNKAGVNVDFIVKLAVSLTNDIYNENEKKLIQKAFNAVKPGETDKNEMKKILGSGLYNDLLMLKVRNSEFEDLDLSRVLLHNNSFPDCEYFILHSANDSIVPKAQGEALFNFMKKHGYYTNFIGTEIFDHSANKVTATGFIKEMKYLINFFDELFKGDNEL